MKLGIGPFLNTYPLDWGFRQRLIGSSMTLVEKTPAELSQMLLLGQLDAALISSVEVLRHPDSLGFCRRVGVCSHNHVRSVIAIRRRSAADSAVDQLLRMLPAPTRICADSASRSSVALLETLLEREYGHSCETHSTPAEEVPGLLDNDSIGLLIGDAALRFLASKGSRDFYSLDLARWWYNQEGLPFVFALWAWPIDRPQPEQLFLDSLECGLGALDQIIEASPFADTRSYLTSNLHYYIGPEEERSLERFAKRLRVPAAPFEHEAGSK